MKIGNKNTLAIGIATLLIFNSTSIGFATSNNSATAKSVSTANTSSTISASALYPHLVSADGKLVIEGKLTSGDYAAILTTLVRDLQIDPKNKKTLSDFKTAYTTAKSYFVINNEKEFDFSNGKYVAKGSKLDASAVSQWMIYYSEALKNISGFSQDKAFQAQIKSESISEISRLTKYLITEYEKDGIFYSDAAKTKTSTKDNVSGIIALHLAKPFVDNTTQETIERILTQSSVKALEAFKPEYKTIDYVADGKEIKLRLEIIAQVLWSSSILADHEIALGRTDNAFSLMRHSELFLNTMLVDGLTINKFSPADEIAFVGGKVSAARKEVAGGNYQKFIYALTKWSKHPYHVFTGNAKKYGDLADTWFIASINFHQDALGIVHDVQWDNPNEKNTAKETPYLAWFLINAQELKSPAVTKALKNSVQVNKTFLFKRIKR